MKTELEKRQARVARVESELQHFRRQLEKQTAVCFKAAARAQLAQRRIRALERRLTPAVDAVGELVRRERRKQRSAAETAAPPQPNRSCT